MYQRRRLVTCSTSLPLDWNLDGIWSNLFTGYIGFRIYIFGQVRVELNGFWCLAQQQEFCLHLDVITFQYNLIGGCMFWLFSRLLFGGMDSSGY